VDLAGELLRWRDGSRDASTIPIKHRSRDMQLPNIARLRPGQAKRCDVGGEP
jgi:hypothetical protein